MELDIIREHVIIVNSGSGFIFQPFGEEYSLILTAKHNIIEEGVQDIVRFSKTDNGWATIAIPENTLNTGLNYFPHPERDICIIKIVRINHLKETQIDLLEYEEDNYVLSGFPETRRIPLNHDKSSWLRSDIGIKLIQSAPGGLVEARVPSAASIEEIMGMSGGCLLRKVGNSYHFAGIQNKMVNAHESERLGRIEFSPVRLFDEIRDLYEDNIPRFSSNHRLAALRAILHTEPASRIMYIDDINVPENIIKRNYTTANQQDKNILFFDEQTRVSLSEVVKTNNKTIVLGNPGLGKTTELKALTLQLWEKGEIIPIFRNLRNFTQTDTIEQYFNIQLQSNIHYIYILDGLDEIPNIQDFISKFEHFIRKLEADGKLFVKFLLSCRTNIYHSIVSVINDFKIFSLKELTHREARELLTSKCGPIVDNLSFNGEIANFIKNPFQVDILAGYIIENQKLPTNSSQLWENYIKTRMTHDKKDKLLRIMLNLPLIKFNSKKLALVNELMRTNTVTENHLFKLLKENTQEVESFTKSPLLDKNIRTDAWQFEHRNIQEYFAALAISEKDFEEIKNFICIPGTSKIHPTLFNTVSFLINLLDKGLPEFESLLELIMQNDPDLLFRADSDRIGTLKTSIFQNYFKEECIEKKLWINTSKGFSHEEIGQFASCPENYTYLLSIITDSDMHARARLSAVEVLAYFTRDSINIVDLKNTFIEILENPSASTHLKARIINCIHNLGLCFSDNSFGDRVIALFGEEDNKEISRAIMDIISSFESSDKYFTFLIKEFELENGIVKRTDKDRTIRGNKYMINNLVLRLSDPEKFAKVASYYFSPILRVSLENDFTNKIKDKLIFLAKSNEAFVPELLENIDTNWNHPYNEKLLATVINKSNTNLSTMRLLLTKHKFEDVKRFLALIAKNDVFQEIKSLYENGKIDGSQIESYRNHVNFNKGEYNKLALDFTETMEACGFIFDNKLQTPKDLEAYHKHNVDKRQENFDLLFNLELLLSRIEAIFTSSGENLNWDSIIAIEDQWYQDNINLDYSLDSEIQILHELALNHHSLNYGTVANILKTKPSIIFEQIKSQLENEKRYELKLEIRESQIRAIEEWTLTTASQVDFDKLIVLHDNNNYSPTGYFHKVQLIVFFNQHFGIPLLQEFWLNCIEYNGIGISEDNQDFLYTLSTKVGNKDLFDSRIIKNINERQMFSLAISNHLEYALEHKLTATYGKIREHFLSVKNVYQHDKNLRKYIDATRDFELLKGYCSDIYQHKCWAAIEILTTLKIHKDICILKSIAYLDTEMMEFNTDAIQVLLKENHISAVSYYYQYLKKGIDISVENTYFLSYDAENFEVIEPLFKVIYCGSMDSFTFNRSDTFFRTYINNLSIVQFDKVQQMLKTIKDNLNIIESDTATFYINLIIGFSLNSYLSSKSNAISFKDAFEYVSKHF